jgi:phosphoenolpyruvate carboxykinase (GTP)
MESSVKTAKKYDMSGAPTKHESLKKWVVDCAELCQPDAIVWINGSEEEKKQLEAQAVASGELIELNQDEWPGCFYHRTATNDVARTEHLTFICTSKKEDVGPTNNWMSPADAYTKAGEYLKSAMKGRTMYVIPFSMGPIGSPFAKIGVELTDSIYVVLNMRIMTRIGEKVLEVLGTKGEFTKCLHSKAELDINKRLILHFPEDNAIWSVNSGYGGNVLLGKKCLALRIASYQAQKEGWLAEHMLIMGVEDPDGNITYVAAAFPSACGKTNLAMLIPPESLRHKGYRIWTVGDDISWMRIDSDGGLWAVNPESGFFGVAPGTNYKTNPSAMETVKKDTIFTNVLLKKDKTIWWEGMDGDIPESGINWEGKEWKPGMTDEKGNKVVGAHANSRFTAPTRNCPSISKRTEHHHGVPISAIIFGGRRISTAPLVYEAFSWQHGVFMGATMASERTAAQVGTLGEVRRDPMAMLPFCGYNMGRYFQHWLNMGKKMTNAPKIFHVNWFKTNEHGKFMWPGFGENLRVLEWIIDRCHRTAGANKTEIGFIPRQQDMDLKGLDISEESLKGLLTINKDEWRNEANGIEQFFGTFGADMPTELKTELSELKKRLG